jgi:hypothetical protein
MPKSYSKTFFKKSEALVVLFSSIESSHCVSHTYVLYLNASTICLANTFSHRFNQTLSRIGTLKSNLVDAIQEGEFGWTVPIDQCLVDVLGIVPIGQFHAIQQGLLQLIPSLDIIVSGSKSTMILSIAHKIRGQ